jgi:site-specific DNA recombinase
LGVERQIADCEERAARLGWQVWDTYVDNDLSAWSGKGRPEYLRLCEDIKTRTIDAVIVWHADRLHRHPRELEDFMALCDAAGDVAIETVTSGELDLGDSTGRAVARILGAVARKESDDRSARIRRKHAELAAAGKVPGGGTRPYGYTADRLHLVPEEAAHIREAATRILAGESLRSVCADFNERGITTSTGRPWTLQSMGRMLRSARISGRREHHGQVAAPAVWPQIISPAESDRLRALRSRAADPALAGRGPRRYLLTGGLLRCGRCGQPMVSRPRTDGVRRYLCVRGPGFGGCGRMATIAEPVEALVAEAILQRLDTPEMAAALADARQADAEAETLHSQVTADATMLDDLAQDFAAHTISHREWMTARQPIQQRIDAARRRLSRISPAHRLDEYAGRSAVLREAWADLPLTRQQAIVRLILDHVDVHPAVKGRNTFDVSRFHPVWRL